MASKNRKNKAKFKWTKELIILLIAIVAILTVTIILSVPSAKTKSTRKFNEAIYASNSANSTSYSLLPEDNVFEEIGHSRLLKRIATGNYVYVVYGSTSSTTILEQLSNINSVATGEEIDTVYFYSSYWVENTEDTDSEDFKLKQKEIEDDLNKSKDADVEEFSLLEYPALLVFNEGKLIFNSQGYDEVDSYNWNMYIQKAFFLSKTNEE